MFKRIFAFGVSFSMILTNLAAKPAMDNKSDEYRLLLSTDEYPYSYDPLDADITNNLDLMKLRSFTPIEIDEKDNFKSSVLESFDYNSSNHQMTWVVKKGIKYSDGTELTAQDIVLSIKRMALKRSSFPVLGSVKGIKEWSAKKYPLSEEMPGINTKDQTIVITFEKSVKNPFFQFTLALFAIQPSRCFDPKNSKLICPVPPASGYYDFADEPPKLDPKDGKYLAIGFSLRKELANARSSHKMPPKILLEYSNLELTKLVGSMEKNSTARTLDSRLSDEFINQFRNSIDIKRLPKTAIIYLLLNPNFEAFKDPECRRIFANKFRDLYGERVKSVKIATKSFSSPVMPGYLTNEELSQLYPETDKGRSLCVEKFAKNPVKFEKTYPFWNKLIEDTMLAVGMPTSGIFAGDGHLSDTYDSFEQNKTAIMTASVNFWPLDLASGFKMFFSQGMHKQLVHVLKDQKLSELADTLYEEANPEKAAAFYKEINKYLYNDGQLNALSYFGNVYLSKSSDVNRLPISTSTPNPWYLFSVK